MRSKSEIIEKIRREELNRRRAIESNKWELVRREMDLIIQLVWILDSDDLTPWDVFESLDALDQI